MERRDTIAAQMQQGIGYNMSSINSPSRLANSPSHIFSPVNSPSRLTKASRFGGLSAPSLDTLRGIVQNVNDEANEQQLKELRYHLAKLKQKEALAADAQRQECESLLEGAVRLRAEKRYLQQETADCRQHHALYKAESNHVTQKWDQKREKLFQDLACQRGKLDECRDGLKDLHADWILEDNPEMAYEQAHQDCLQHQHQSEEWEEATLAAEELSDRLTTKLGDMEEEVYVMKRKLQMGAAGFDDKAMVTPAEFMKIQQETRALAAKVALESAGVGREARRLWIHGDSEIPRLKAAEVERNRLQRMLMDTRWQHDNLQRDYTRVILGLEEQESSQAQTAKELAKAITETRDEGEEMLASVKQNDLQVAEMRHDRMETELFVQHLNSHIARLEDERVNLHQVVKEAASAERRPGFDPNLRRLGPNGHNEVLEWLKQDRDNLLDESMEALQNDEAEAYAVAAQCETVELDLMQVEERNTMLRSEVTMAEPMLANQRASAAAQARPYARPTFKKPDPAAGAGYTPAGASATFASSGYEAARVTSPLSPQVARGPTKSTMATQPSKRSIPTGATRPSKSSDSDESSTESVRPRADGFLRLGLSQRLADDEEEEKPVAKPKRGKGFFR